MTFREGRELGASVELVAARAEGLEDREGGRRSVEACEGGGLRELGFFGRGRRTLARGGGGTRRLEDVRLVEVVFGGALRVGGGIIPLSFGDIFWASVATGDPVLGETAERSCLTWTVSSMFPEPFPSSRATVGTVA
jgi:hypothetical protein